MTINTHTHIHHPLPLHLDLTRRRTASCSPLCPVSPRKMLPRPPGREGSRQRRRASPSNSGCGNETTFSPESSGGWESDETQSQWTRTVSPRGLSITQRSAPFSARALLLPTRTFTLLSPLLPQALPDQVLSVSLPVASFAAARSFSGDEPLV